MKESLNTNINKCWLWLRIKISNYLIILGWPSIKVNVNPWIDQVLINNLGYTPVIDLILGIYVHVHQIHRLLLVKHVLVLFSHLPEVNIVLYLVNLILFPFFFILISIIAHFFVLILRRSLMDIIIRLILILNFLLIRWLIRLDHAQTVKIILLDL
jgi:hypothetical protein